MNEKEEIIFYSGVNTVTGANFCFQTPHTKILIDCGLIQGDSFALEKNKSAFAYDPSTIQALIVTHAHLDHIGRIPFLIKNGFKGIIYSTQETMEIAKLILEDAALILEEEAKRNNTEPLFTVSELPKVFALWQSRKYREEFIVGEVRIQMKDAGHVLGSAMIEMVVLNRKILFSGDLGNSPAPILKDTEKIGDADYLVIESTYGDKNHESREQRKNNLERIIKKTINRGGTLVIPAFSLDRTQVLLYELNNMIEEGIIPPIPVYVDSPLAIKITEIYKNSSNLFNDRVRQQIDRGDNIFDFPNVKYAVSANESRDIAKDKSPKIILAGSGMSVGGRVIGHEEHLLPEAKNTILLVGYQTAGSLGRRLAEGDRSVNIYGKKIKVKAEIETLYGYSAHKDSDNLIDFIADGPGSLKQVFVVMGEPHASMHLAQRINDELGIKAFVPKEGERYEIVNN